MHKKIVASLFIASCLVSVNAQELKNEKLFDNINNNFVLMFGISEFEDKDLEKEFVKKLNNDVNFLEFENWINSEE